MDPRSEFGWRKVLLVARREYAATVRTKAFVIALVLMPVLTLSAALLPLFATQLSDGTPKRCAIVDQTGVLVAPLAATLQRERRDLAAPGASPVADLSRDPIAGVTLFDAGRELSDELRATLSEQVRSGELFAFVSIPSDVLEPGSQTPVVYTSNTPSSRAMQRWLVRALEAEVHALRLAALGVDPEPVRRAQAPLVVEEGSLYERTPERIIRAPAPDPIRDVVVPVAACLVVFFSLMLGASPLMQSTLEEKMHRIAEVIVSSIPPLQLMLGKLLGALFVSYTILGSYLAGGFFAAAQAGLLDPLTLLDGLAILAFQAIAFVMYGSVFLAVGSACNDLKETQTLMLPAVMLITTPLLFLQLVLDEPNGTAATFLSFFPFFTPPLMLLRSLVAPGAPGWQIALGLLTSGLLAAACLFASSRIFRIGLLAQGVSPSLRQLLRWMRSG